MADALGLLAESCSDFFSVEHSVQGKAGALWETAFPLLHPLPSPRNTPSFGSRIHSSRPGFGFAFRRVLREPPLFLRDGRWNAARLAGLGVSGKELRDNGALDRSGSREGRAVECKDARETKEV